MITRKLNEAFLVVLLLCFASPNLFGQSETDEHRISTHRKGTLSVYAKPGQEVHIRQLSHEFWFGAALSNGFVGSMSEADKQQYAEKFLQNFNAAVTENALKWHSMEKEKGVVDYSVVDALLEWTDRHHIPLRGHNIFWGIPKFVQEWLTALDDESLEQTLRVRALDVTTRYRGRFAGYDLNNEMVHGNFYEDRLGPDVTKKMVDWSHQGDPDAQLFLNDYDILTGNRLDDYLKQIRGLIGQGVRIAGIGVQGHLHAESFDRNELRRALDSLAVFGLPILVTEFNVPGQRSKYYRENIRELTMEEEIFTAGELVDYYKICFAHPSVEGILMWGFWAGANWIPASSLYRRDWSPTALAEAYQDLIFREWWTEHRATVGHNGVVSLPAFFGTYEVQVGDEVRTVTLNRGGGSAKVDFLMGAK
ncbi:MAG: endo-1,4-beta-xylanase [Lunatimonas sp.]|uniref:endo-1,4-beta-xylanase n=1 Tax=Lunatimonas sp. TaxID=2060141 RepID=UPI00263A5874|nr:endo-1,4-beta-xylanase [Lunatimonas sp.]MCC5937176.1 endo-1,4-beta-xylanase [Lunatimonas sp.]